MEEKSRIIEDISVNVCFSCALSPRSSCRPLAHEMTENKASDHSHKRWLQSQNLQQDDDDDDVDVDDDDDGDDGDVDSTRGQRATPNGSPLLPSPKNVGALLSSP